MVKSTIYRGGSLLVSAITFAFAGFAGQAMAATGSISDTGPDSHNTVSITAKAECTVTNNNNISANNSTTQNASTGDVTVDGNTNAGGWNAGWNDWSPATWQAHGYTYDQWHVAFMSYMSANEGNFRSNWGHISGGATSGNASNSNSTTTNISIKNGVAGGKDCVAPATGSNGGSIDQTGPGSTNGVTLGSSTTKKTTNNNGVNGANTTGQNAVSGAVTGSSNTNLGGGAGSGAAGNSNGTGSNVNVDNGGQTPVDPGHGTGNGGSTATISNTGPDSKNSVTIETINKTTVTNNNNTTITGWTNQNASTGDVTTNNNTSAGGNGSGAAGNANGTANGVTIQN